MWTPTAITVGFMVQNEIYTNKIKKNLLEHINSKKILPGRNQTFNFRRCHSVYCPGIQGKPMLEAVRHLRQSSDYEREEV